MLIHESDIRPFLDYPRMNFYLTNIDGKYKKALNRINTPKEFADIQQKTDYSEKIDAEKIFFNENFPSDLDLFQVPFFNYSTYISERLYENLIQNEISGGQLNESSLFE